MEALEQITTPMGRVYRGMKTRNLYPSVTTVTGIMTKKHIDAWKARVGEAKANEISHRASNHGTRWHALMEDYLHGDIPLVPTHDEFMITSKLFIERIHPHISDIKGIEFQLYSTPLKCAGTADLIASWDGIPSIIDWKTTSHAKYPSGVSNYWCQLAAYGAMVKEHLHYWPEQLVLVFNESDQDVYYYTEKIPEWVKKFVEVRKQYEESDGYVALKKYIEEHNL